MSRPKLSASDKAWLAQYTPVDEKSLTEAGADFLMRIRALFRRAKAGKLPDGHLEFYLIDKETGPFSGSFPPWCCPGFVAPKPEPGPDKFASAESWDGPVAESPAVADARHEDTWHWHGAKQAHAKAKHASTG